MVRKRAAAGLAQAWIEPRGEDAEAVSALAVARAHLAAGRVLASLRRLRVFELSGPLPARGELEALLHRSIQFYNPQKERCVVRLAPAEIAPVATTEHAVLVYDRDQERRPAAERWWRHETGTAIEVREGVAWMLGWAQDARDPIGLTEELAVLRDRRHGLLCNPHAQEHRIAGATIPLPWMADLGGTR